MQWTDETGAGFTTGIPWLGINGNYRRIHNAHQRANPDSIWHYYQKLIRLRAGSDTLKYGDFTPEYAKGDVIGYTRTQGTEKHMVLLNFSKRKTRVVYTGEVVISNIGRAAYDGFLGPYEAIVLKTNIIKEQ